MAKKARKKARVAATTANEPLILYSTLTWLAYSICEKYYDHKHYVWCTPHFDGSTAPPGAVVPPTSSPREIYHSLAREVEANDAHSAKINSNKVGILNGATAQLAARVITKLQHDEIVAVVKIATVPDYKPVLLVIPFAGVRNIVKPVPVNERAHPMSPEFIIESLPSSLFHAIRL